MSNKKLRVMACSCLKALRFIVLSVQNHNARIKARIIESWPASWLQEENIFPYNKNVMIFNIMSRHMEAYGTNTSRDILLELQYGVL